MRSYPRLVFKSKDEILKVWNEEEEIKASNDGYNSHWDPKFIELREGTDRGILRGDNEKKEEKFDYKSLKWPKLKTYAKELEGIYKTEIVTRTSKRDDILAKIDELLNGNNG